ncbi:MAG: hypothetical protein WCK78_15280 [Paludibacter sp.]
MYPIENKFSALMWLQIIQNVKAGDQHEAEILKAENQIRTENNQPIVEQELNEMIK